MHRLWFIVLCWYKTFNTSTNFGMLAGVCLPMLLCKQNIKCKSYKACSHTPLHTMWVSVTESLTIYMYDVQQMHSSISEIHWVFVIVDVFSNKFFTTIASVCTPHCACVGLCETVWACVCISVQVWFIQDCFPIRVDVCMPNLCLW